MPNYKTSLINPSSGLFDAVLSTDKLSIAFNDYSNYTASTEAGNQNANFTQYRVIIVEHQSGSQYIFSSVPGGGNVLITPGNSGINAYTYVIQNGDGVYTFYLASVPTWNNSSSYTANLHYVYRSGVLYKALITGAGSDPATHPLNWQVVTLKDLPQKYLDTQYFLVTCSSDACEKKIVNCAACIIVKNNCNPEILCKNETVLNALKVQILIRSTHLSFDDGDFVCAAQNIDLLKLICGCDNCNDAIIDCNCG